MQQMRKFTVKRWKEHRHETGYEHLYQGRYKRSPVETEGYFYQVVRYVERNALRAAGPRGPSAALVQPPAWRERRPGVSHPFCLAIAQTGGLDRNRQPAAIRGGTAGDASLRESRLSTRQRRLGCRDGEGAAHRVNASATRAAQATVTVGIACLTFLYTPNLVAVRAP